MARRNFGRPRRGRIRPPAPKKAAAPEEPSPESAKEVARRLRAVGRGKSAPDYRRRSLEIHGWICAKCGTEFSEENLHLLTVHHRDGNPRNNPPDGSNWENLCVYCHEDEHSRDLLGRYLSD